MRITSANLQMAATHVASQRHEISQSLRMWVGNERPDFEGRQGRQGPTADKAHISDAGKAAQSREAHAAEKDDESRSSDPKLELIRTMLEFLTGRKIKIFDASELNASTATEQPADPNQAAAPEADQRPAGYGVEYDYHESYSETEQTTFSAAGTVRTADGREISFQLGFSLARSYQEESNVSLRLGDAVRRKDPLVLNFSGTAAQLTDTRFKFDLDADGAADQINFVAPGSGFLALDRNGDGKVNDGSELFGPATGDGFRELAALDSDRNGWIDENDQTYQDLRLWTKDANGNDQLKSLAEAQVGAIALAHVSTPFDIKDDLNIMTGQVRSSGVFLQEDGKAGTIQQIDLTV
ncbi:MAG: hypothetical protein H6R10_1221 [Rhodocyclaceae bacterium]|nr:hypothetical protein [Rhodocyclaceae bacterium]